MPRPNRVDPWGDAAAVPERGLFTGNRGCLVDDGGRVVRHHNGSLWIICRLSFRDWRHPLAAPRTWTPLFFLDDAVALAAGHRPCGLCRRADYQAYRHGVEASSPSSGGRHRPVLAVELNRRLAAERLRRGRGLKRAGDRRVWTSAIDELPSGSVIVSPDGRAAAPLLVTDGHLQPFAFAGWGAAIERPGGIDVEVLTPPTSVAALGNGFTPQLHPSARESGSERERASPRPSGGR